jgi:ABC-type Na+ efflux pump permease subunit
MDAILQVLIPLIGALLGMFVYERTKRKSAEALNDNQETLSKVNELDKELSKNEGLLAAEEEKRKDLKEGMENEKRSISAKDSILEFFNRRKP